MLKALRTQFPPQATDITTEAFLQTAKEALLRVGKKAAGRLLDGVLHDKYPTP